MATCSSVIRRRRFDSATLRYPVQTFISPDESDRLGDIVDLYKQQRAAEKLKPIILRADPADRIR